MIKSQCSVYGKRKSRYLSKAEIQAGSFGSVFAPLVRKVTAPLVNEAAKKVIPAFGNAAVTAAISGSTHKAAAELKK